MAKIISKEGNYIFLRDTEDDVQREDFSHLVHVGCSIPLALRDISTPYVLTSPRIGTVQLTVDDLLDGDGIPYTLESWEDFYVNGTGGFNTAPGGSGAAWGAISGDILAQADLVQRLSGNVKIIGLTINANVSQTLYTDGFVTLSWDGTFKQPTYTIPVTTPLGAWGSHDASQLKLNGNATTSRSSAGDVSALAGTFYFGDNGTRVAQNDLNNYASRGWYALNRELFVDSFPSYRIDIAIGGTGAASVLIDIVNPTYS